MNLNVKPIALTCAAFAAGAFVQSKLISPSYQSGQLRWIGLSPDSHQSEKQEQLAQLEALKRQPVQTHAQAAPVDSAPFGKRAPDVPEKQEALVQADGLSNHPQVDSDSLIQAREALPEAALALSFVSEEEKAKRKSKAMAVLNSLTLQLDLYPEQVEQLMAYMEQKLTLQNEMKGYATMYELGLLSKEDGKPLYDEYMKKWDSLTQQHQSNMQNSLTYDQLQQYQAYENTKAELTYDRRQVSFQSKLVDAVPDIDSSRLAQVAERLESYQPQVFDVPLGTDGFSQSNLGEYKFSNKQALKQLTDILTEEEILAFIELQKAKRKAAAQG